jgi:hypothetical protein
MIYIIKHRECETPKLRGYQDLGVGKLFNGCKDNINGLNPFINEMTAIYDIWKNKKDEIKGQIQYRKHLEENGEILSYDRIKRILQDYDIIATKPYIDGNGIYKGLRNEIGDEQVQHTLDKYYNKLIEIEPALEGYFKMKSFHYGNMFICKREIYDDYCKWLFSLMLPITEEFVIEDAKLINKNRMMGYIGERLLTYYIIMHNLNVKECDVVTTGDRLPVTEV